MKKLVLVLLLISMAVNITGCATLKSMFSSIPVGALSGTLIGAGTGAGIGAVISDGDPGKSALLGAAIGLVAGGITGAIVERQDEEKQRREFLERVRHNQQDIYNKEREIDILRQQVESEIPHGLPPQETRKYLYGGE
ncbi:MAG: YMGG-like glycine zipper-containing protein [Bdellovibrionota bacterium]